ncbi:MAG: COG2426 family protein [Christensenellales bacterium]|jgi:uncharacterized membrane protein
MGFLSEVGIWKTIGIAFLSMVPGFEGRYALSAGIASGMPVPFTFILAFVFSTIPLIFVFLLLKPVLQWLYTLPAQPEGAFWQKTPLRRKIYEKTVSFLHKFAHWVHNRSLKKAKGLDAKGLFGLFVFIAVPLPGTGVWTGSAIAVLLEMNPKHAIPTVILGNLAACTIMLLATLGVITLFG